MTPTRYRDEVAMVAKIDEAKAASIATKITDPWFQAQAWSHVARYATKPIPYARKAARSAGHGKDDYQRSAVRAWEIVALAERDLRLQARASLTDAVNVASTVVQDSSRAESLFLLFQAAFKISTNDAENVAEVLQTTCSSGHWRAVRARKNAEEMLRGDILPREFFW